ncbi:hypothetical protein AB1Y20_014286 [Prymnesium parvum]|uniref:RING-type domain-containing protein n=1 Tax=Prymnesium parvum TaxID=97485 RepID=A0AB34IFT0_PRYPA
MASHLGEAAAFPQAAATSDAATVPPPLPPDDDDDEGCLVCAAAPREVRLRPCGHSTTCTQCALRLATSASPLRCPTCRAVATHVGWDPRGRPLAPRRVATYEDSPAAAEHSVGEFVRIAGVEPYVFHRPGAIPQELCDSLGAALEVDALRGGPEESLLGVPRDPCWTDLIDPDLCLLDGEPARWLPAAVDVDAAGAATWASWVNHLHPRRHAALLHLLARLLTLALPSLEAAAALRLAPSRLRLVLGAYAHTPPRHGGAYTPSGWHTDGTRAERVLATACCYLEVAGREWSLLIGSVAVSIRSLEVQ